MCRTTPRLSDYLTNNILELGWSEWKLSTSVINVFMYEKLSNLIPICACLVFILIWFHSSLLPLLFQAHYIYLQSFKLFFLLLVAPPNPLSNIRNHFPNMWVRNICIYYVLPKQTKNSTHFTCGHGAMVIFHV